MTTYDVPHPPIVSREQWLVARKKLLAQEKELTRQYDRVNAVRRRLPMVRIEKNYMFEGPGGEESLLVYLTDRFYNPQDEGRIAWNDPGINYDWDTQHK